MWRSVFYRFSNKSNRSENCSGKRVVNDNKGFDLRQKIIFCGILRLRILLLRQLVIKSFLWVLVFELVTHSFPAWCHNYSTAAICRHRQFWSRLVIVIKGFKCIWLTWEAGAQWSSAPRNLGSNLQAPDSQPDAMTTQLQRYVGTVNFEAV